MQTHSQKVILRSRFAMHTAFVILHLHKYPSKKEVVCTNTGANRILGLAHSSLQKYLSHTEMRIVSLIKLQMETC